MHHRRRLGYTIVEIIVVISVIAVLATITYIGYNGWQRSAVSSQVKSDLQGAAAAMETARSFGEGYPSTVPASFTAGEGVVLTGGSSDGITFCITGTSTRDSGVQFYINEQIKNDEPLEGNC